MNEENQRPIMSRSVVNSGKQSIQGYLNTEEFMKGFRNSTKWGVAVAALSAALLEVLHHTLANFNAIYTGPGAALLGGIAGVGAMSLKLYINARKAVDDGKPILFSEDDDVDG
jgi:hypothetical protein